MKPALAVYLYFVRGGGGGGGGVCVCVWRGGGGGLKGGGHYVHSLPINIEY